MAAVLGVVSAFLGLLLGLTAWVVFTVLTGWLPAGVAFGVAIGLTLIVRGYRLVLLLLPLCCFLFVSAVVAIGNVLGEVTL